LVASDSQTAKPATEEHAEDAQLNDSVINLNPFSMVSFKGIGHRRRTQIIESYRTTLLRVVQTPWPFLTGKEEAHYLRYLNVFQVAMVLTTVTSACGTAQTTAVYLAQAAAGSANGSNCANAYAYTFFNAPANWGSGASQIGPGTTVHICGTWTGSPGQSFLTAQGSGNSSSPVTIHFETNAVMQAPYFSSTGTIVLTGQSYIVLDGGTNGVMQNTLNGSPGASCPGGPCTNIQSSVAIWAQPCTNCEIKNLTVANLYVHTQCVAPWTNCDTAVNQTAVNAVRFQGSNVLIHDNTFHDIGWVLLQNYTADSGVALYRNNIYNMDHGIACAGADYVVPSMSIYNNHFHDMAAWDTGPADAYHHDGIHCFNGSLGKIQNIYIYNNLFDGNEGYNVSAWLFLEGGPEQPGSTPWTDATGTAYIFNNAVIGSNDIGIGQISISNGNAHQALNNVIIAQSLGKSGGCLGLFALTNITI